MYGFNPHDVDELLAELRWLSQGAQELFIDAQIAKVVRLLLEHVITVQYAVDYPLITFSRIVLSKEAYLRVIRPDMVSDERDKLHILKFDHASVLFASVG